MLVICFSKLVLFWICLLSQTCSAKAEYIAEKKAENIEIRLKERLRNISGIISKMKINYRSTDWEKLFIKKNEDFYEF